MNQCRDCAGKGTVWSKKAGTYVLCFHPISARKRRGNSGDRER